MTKNRGERYRVEQRVVILEDVEGSVEDPARQEGAGQRSDRHRAREDPLFGFVAFDHLSKVDVVGDGCVVDVPIVKLFP